MARKSRHNFGGSIRKIRGLYYYELSLKGRRKSVSLRTSDYRIAVKTARALYPNLFKELMFGEPKSDISFPEIVKEFLTAKHGWSPKTRAQYEQILSVYVAGEPLPNNPNTRDKWARCINAVWNFGLDRGMTSKHEKLKRTTPPPRTRCFSKGELTEIFAFDLGEFYEFAYLTAGRSGEIRQLDRSAIDGDYLRLKGKSGERVIKPPSRALNLLTSFDFRKDQVSNTFRKACLAHGIKDAKFHDLRRTRGRDLILEGIPITHVSLYLGHSTVTVTQRHYAPILPREITVS